MQCGIKLGSLLMQAQVTMLRVQWAVGAVGGGVWVASLGTSATLCGTSPIAVWDPTGTVAPFCDATGHWLPLVCTQNCSQPVEEVRCRTCPGNTLDCMVGAHCCYT